MRLYLQPRKARMAELVDARPKIWYSGDVQVRFLSGNRKSLVNNLQGFFIGAYK